MNNGLQTELHMRHSLRYKLSAWSPECNFTTNSVAALQRHEERFQSSVILNLGFSALNSSLEPQMSDVHEATAHFLSFVFYSILISGVECFKTVLFLIKTFSWHDAFHLPKSFFCPWVVAPPTLIRKQSVRNMSRRD